MKVKKRAKKLRNPCKEQFHNRRNGQIVKKSGIVILRYLLSHLRRHFPVLISAVKLFSIISVNLKKESFILFLKLNLLLPLLTLVLFQNLTLLFHMVQQNYNRNLLWLLLRGVPLAYLRNHFYNHHHHHLIIIRIIIIIILLVIIYHQIVLFKHRHIIQLPILHGKEIKPNRKSMRQFFLQAPSAKETDLTMNDLTPVEGLKFTASVIRSVKQLR